MTSSSGQLHNNLKSHHQWLPLKLSTVLLCKPRLQRQPTCQRILYPARRLRPQPAGSAGSRAGQPQQPQLLCKHPGSRATRVLRAPRRRRQSCQEHRVCPVIRRSLSSCSSLAPLINSRVLASTAQGSEPSTAACQLQGGEAYGLELQNTGAGIQQKDNKGIQQEV